MESKQKYSEEEKPMTEENEKGLETPAIDPTVAERDQEEGREGAQVASS